MKKILTVILLACLLFTCKEENPVEQKKPKDYIYKNLSVGQTGDAEYPTVVIDRNGNSILIRKDQSSGQIIGGTFTDKESNSFYIEINSSGNPSKFVAEGYILLFENYSGNKVDVAVIKPNGEISIHREVQFDQPNIPIQNNDKHFKLSGVNSLTSDLRYIGYAASIASCVTFLILSPTGIAIPAAIIACGSAIIETILLLTENENEELNQSSQAFSFVGSIVGCFAEGNIFECIGFVASLGQYSVSVSENTLSQQSNYVNIAQGALLYGYGDVQVTLTWDNTSDLDIWVTDPFGEKIYFANPSSASGGQLDVDDIDGYGPENIFWPTNQAPSGIYTVELDYFSGYGTANYSILVQAFGNSKSFNGQINPNETLFITTFDESGINSPLPKLLHKRIKQNPKKTIIK